ncbi:hypothetical protein FNV43_RR21540 [Rhamnella rubrinervis]|uniref:Cytochrome P450 71A1 n=1 Tax=Rhamnella rubrinervis TaxID=2594499 RepID=A0A8K0GV52_9ROSA|nr:hypothetical protein FNV43_RR21540 [Rhamnella rubrinervis]
MQQNCALWQELLLHPLFFSVFILSLLFLFLRRNGSTSGKLNLPPSPPRLPLIGNLHQLGSLPHRSLRALAHKSTAPSILLFGCEDVGFSPYGEYWRQARKISVVELLSIKRVQEFQFVREEETAAMVNRIRSVCVNGSTINIGETMIAIANSIVSRCVLGKSFMEEDGRSRIGELSRQMMLLLGAFSVGDFFPGLKWIDVARGLLGRMKATFRELDEFLDQLIEEHKAFLDSSSSASGTSEANHFMDILLRLIKDGMLDFDLTKNNIKGILVDMFVAGTDTSSTGLEWLMAELIRHPKVMKRAQEEVRSVVGKKSKIDMEDISKMHYLKCVVRETLRLHPPLPLLLPRETATSIELGGYHIPANTKVFINAWAIQRDPSSWDMAEEFIPERFENSSVDFKGQDSQFIPLGTGRRGCPGMIFGVASIEYVTANLLYWFDFKLPEDGGLGKDLDMTEAYGLTACKKVPLRLVPIPYSP